MEKKLKKDFLKKGKTILRKQLYLAEHSLNPGIAQRQLFELLSKVLLETDLNNKLNAQTAKDIIALLKAGKVSIADAKDLMSMLKDKAEIDELPVLLRKLEELEKKT